MTNDKLLFQVGRDENAMGHREAAAFLIGRAAAYDGPAYKAVYAFAYKVHEELMEQAKMIQSLRETDLPDAGPSARVDHD